MPKIKSSKLPLGVSVVSNRPGLYRLSVMIYGKRYSEYHRPDADLTQRQLQSALQKAVDAFREKAERGSLRGHITDKSRFSEAAEWYLSTAMLEWRGSTLDRKRLVFTDYLIPAFGNIQVRSITSPMITQLLADLSDHGGGYTVYVAAPAFVEIVKAKSGGAARATATKIGVGENTLYRARARKTLLEQTAKLIAEYFCIPFENAFERNDIVRPLKASYINYISSSLSGLFTALVKNEVLTRNPVTAATKPRIGEAKRGAYLNNAQLPIFMSALDGLTDDDVRVCLTLCLKDGLRGGEARALRWPDIDSYSDIIHINHSVGKEKGKPVIGDPKTNRSVRALPAGHVMYMLSQHKAKQIERAALMGIEWDANGLVCPNTNGGIMPHSRLYYAVKKIVKTHKELPQNLRPHSLRHTFVSLLISQGVDIVHVASLAGDTVEVISKIYAHAFSEREAMAMDQIGAVFARLSAPVPAPQFVVNL
jgi:integrase